MAVSQIGQSPNYRYRSVYNKNKYPRHIVNRRSTNGRRFHLFLPYNPYGVRRHHPHGGRNRWYRYGYGPSVHHSRRRTLRPFKNRELSQMAEAIAAHKDTDVNAKTTDGTTPLMTAAGRCAAEGVMVLLKSAKIEVG